MLMSPADNIAAGYVMLHGGPGRMTSKPRPNPENAALPLWLSTGVSEEM